MFFLFFFLVFEDFWRKIAKEQERKSGQTRAPTLHRREPMPWCSPVQPPCHYEAEVPKKGTPRVRHYAAAEGYTTT